MRDRELLNELNHLGRALSSGEVVLPGSLMENTNRPGLYWRVAR